MLQSATIKVNSGVTLTVDPGVTVAFAGGASAQLLVQGTLRAIGTAANPIVFTSSQGLSGSGAPGQFGSIDVSSGNANSRFSHATFRYGGSGSGGLYASGALSVKS